MKGSRLTALLMCVMLLAACMPAFSEDAAPIYAQDTAQTDQAAGEEAQTQQQKQGGWFNRLMDSAGATFSEAWDGMADSASQAWNSVSQTASDAWGAVSDKASDVWGTVTDKASDVWGTVTDKAADVWGTVSETATDAWNTVSETVKGWIGEVERYARENNWDEKVEEAWQTLKRGAEEGGKIAKEELTKAYDTVRNWISENGGKIESGVTEAIDGVAAQAGVFRAAAVIWYDTAKAFIDRNADTVSDEVRVAMKTVSDYLADAGSVTKEALTQAFATIREWLGQIDAPESGELTETLDALEIMSQDEQL